MIRIIIEILLYLLYACPFMGMMFACLHCATLCLTADEYLLPNLSSQMILEIALCTSRKIS